MATRPSHFLLVLGLFCVVAFASKCPVPWAEVGSDCLYFSPDRKSWNDAQASCRTMSAFLATDDTSAKHDFFRQALSVLDEMRVKNFYIGGNDRVIEGQWRWLETGTAISSRFSKWAPDQPSPNKTVAMDRNCMRLTWVDSDLFWSDWTCNDRNTHYICEKPVSSV